MSIQGKITVGHLWQDTNCESEGDALHGEVAPHHHHRI